MWVLRRGGRGVDFIGICFLIRFDRVFFLVEVYSCFFRNFRFVLKEFKLLRVGRRFVCCFENYFFLIFSYYSWVVNCKILMREFDGSVNKK